MRFIGSTAAAKQAGITYRQLHYWVTVGAVVPVLVGCGSGSRTYWTPLQVEHLRAIGLVRQHLDVLSGGGGPAGGGVTGVEASSLRPIWDALESAQPWSFGIFVREDGTVDLISPGQLDLHEVPA